MTITEILNLVGNQAVGIEDPTADDLSIWLRYLNKVHRQLFAATKFFNPFLPRVREVVGVVDGQFNSFLNPWSSIDFVYMSDVTQRPIYQMAYDRIMNIDPSLSRPGVTPIGWYIVGSNIFSYPSYTGDLGVNYTIGFVPFTLTTLPGSIPYPPEYQDVLVNGTIYELYIGEMKNRSSVDVQAAKKDWLDGKTMMSRDFMKLSGYQYLPNYRTI